MVPSRLSLFRNAAVAAAKSLSSRFPSGLAEPVREFAWAGAGGAAVISTKALMAACESEIRLPKLAYKGSIPFARSKLLYTGAAT